MSEQPKAYSKKTTQETSAQIGRIARRLAKRAQRLEQLDPEIGDTVRSQTKSVVRGIADDGYTMTIRKDTGQGTNIIVEPNGPRVEYSKRHGPSPLSPSTTLEVKFSDQHSKAHISKGKQHVSIPAEQHVAVAAAALMQARGVIAEQEIAQREIQTKLASSAQSDLNDPVK